MTQGTIVHDDRTPEEIAYDSLKSGAAYVKPTNDGPFGTDVTDEFIAMLGAAEGLSPKEIGIARAREAALETIAEGFDDDDALTPEEEIVIDLILARTPDATDSFRRGVIDGYRAGCEIKETLADAGMYEPVPPLEGFPTDRALIYDTINNTMVCVDRRDGEIGIAPKDGGEHIILRPAQAVALFQFFQSEAISAVMLHAWHRYLREMGDPLMRELMDKVASLMPLPELPEAGEIHTAALG